MTLFTKNPLERQMMQRPYPGKEETPRTPAPEGHFCCGCSRYGTVCLPDTCRLLPPMPNVPMRDQMQRKRM